MASSSHITKVAVVGATGHSGRFITEALLKTGKHTITALTRGDRQHRFPDGVARKMIDYSRPETLVEALRGQDALVITLNNKADIQTELSLVHAAGDAGVKWILPNDWSPDSTDEQVVKDIMIFQPKVALRKAISEIGKSHYISVSTGFWYEWSLAIPEAYGIDLLNHTATFFDDGEAKITTSTWPQVGRAVASLLSLPVTPGNTTEACLENFKDQVIYIKSFTVNQKEMLESALRVTGTKETDWTIMKESSHERYTKGLADMQSGSQDGFVKMLYTRIFYPDGCGNIDHKGLANESLGLPTEDLDQATQRAIDRAKVGPWS
ncbi:hypothetical protein N7492_001985 [Penicillium capsulatum]|uniref:NmrA-like domain-containing protein n=1 Tax=Penicillium capsulatum TaxID=69766 RepID=A0A9W9IHR4_9EURO|nr:hypothetical protein N7492_001985 [Penicillium capsulatum]KAJ6123395.1 hypothetical protein N7512_005860 [Penicillium capsulatum]